MKNKQDEELKEQLEKCKTCTSLIQADKKYCKLKLQDENVLKESGVINKKECGYYRNINY